MIKKILFFIFLCFIPFSANASNLNVDFTSLTDEEIEAYNSILEELKPVLEEKEFSYFANASVHYVSVNRGYLNLIFFQTSDINNLSIKLYNDSNLTLYNSSSEDLYYYSCTIKIDSTSGVNTVDSCKDAISKFPKIYKNTLKSSSYITNSSFYIFADYKVPYYLSNETIKLEENSFTVNYSDVTYKDNITNHNLFYLNHFGDQSDVPPVVEEDDPVQSINFYLQAIFFIIFIVFIYFLFRACFRFLHFLFPF